MAAAPEISSTPAPPVVASDAPAQKKTTPDALDAFHRQLDLLYRERKLNGLPPSQLDISSPLDFGGKTDFDKLYNANRTLDLDSNRTGNVTRRAKPETDLALPNGKPIPLDHQPPVEAPLKGVPATPEPKTKGEHVEKGKEAPSATKPSDNLEQSRARLEATAQERFKNDPQGLANFEKDIKAFEQRMTKNPNAAVEEQRTYDSINKLLVGPSSVVTDADRLTIAKDIMHKVAYVDNINQGQTNCCGPASLEARLYERAPSQAARLVEEVALTGKYTEWPDGHVITMDRKSIAHHVTDVSAGADQGVEVRSLADQIFQTTAYNIYIDSVNQKQHPPGKVRYEAGDPSIDNPTGERLVDYATHPPKTISQNDTLNNPKYKDYDYGGLPGFTNDIENIYERMSGVPEDGFNIHAFNTTSRQDFKDKLAEAKREGKFPLIMAVDEAEEPFKSQSGGESGFHYISIRDYNPETGEIDYTNGWFGSRKLKIGANEMFRAMHIPADKELVSEAAQGLKESTDPDDMKAGLFHDLLIFEQEKRVEVLNELSKELGKNMWDLLTDEQLKELGISRPNIFDRGWDSFTGMFK